MKALIVTGGEAPARERIFGREKIYSLICAADSGLETLAEWGISPDLIVGDMDSLSNPDLLLAYPHAEVLRFSTLKDDTDTEIALSEIRKRSSDKILLAGGGGGRLDHILAIRAIFERELRPEEWHTARETVFLVRSGFRLRMRTSPGAAVSIFPLASGASLMESVGLLWSLSGLVWKAGQFGISNVSTGEDFQVEAGLGELLVVTSPDAEPY